MTGMKCPKCWGSLAYPDMPCPNCDAQPNDNAKLRARIKELEEGLHLSRKAHERDLKVFAAERDEARELLREVLDQFAPYDSPIQRRIRAHLDGDKE